MYEGPIQDLIDELSRLPGIGPKSAQRLAFYIVKAPPEDARRLSEALLGAKDRVRFCRQCNKSIRPPPKTTLLFADALWTPQRLRAAAQRVRISSCELSL